MDITSACLKYSDAKTIKSRKGCGSRFFMLGALALGVDPASRFALICAEATPTVDFAAMTVEQLREELKLRELSTKGRKSQLIKRLQTAFEPAVAEKSADAESDGGGVGGGPIRDKLVSPRHPIPHPQFPFSLSLSTPINSTIFSFLRRAMRVQRQLSAALPSSRLWRACSWTRAPVTEASSGCRTLPVLPRRR